MVEINTKEVLSKNDLFSIYLIYKNETIILLEKDFYELCQSTRDFSCEMNGIFFETKKFEIIKYIWYNKNGDK